MAYCKNCGKPMEADAKVCRICGTHQLNIHQGAPSVQLAQGATYVSASDPFVLLVVGGCTGVMAAIAAIVSDSAFSLVLSFIAGAVSVVMAILTFIDTKNANQSYQMGNLVVDGKYKNSVQTYLKIGWIFVVINVILIMLAIFRYGCLHWGRRFSPY